LLSCDFAPTLDKDILEAQRAIDQQDFNKAASINDDILRKSFKRQIRRKVLYQQGEIYLVHLENPQKALNYFQEIYQGELDPYWQVKSLEKIADIYFFNLKMFDEAKQSYEILAGFKPPLKREDYYVFQMARSLMEGKNFLDAYKIFKTISEDKKNPFETDALFQRGLIHFYLKEWGKSVELFKKFIGLSSSKEMSVQAKFLIANCFETQEKLQEAYNIYYSLIDSYPNIEVIKSRLKSLYERRQARKR